MKKYNTNNERIKRKYLTFLKQAKGQNEASIDAVAKAISRFEKYNQHKDFKSFHFEQAISFKRHLASQRSRKTGASLSAATITGTARQLKAFFEWLSQQVGYKSRITYSDAEYFNVADKVARTAKATRSKPVPTIDQIKHALNLMPTTTIIEKRDKALFAFTLLTGARDGAIISLKVKHVDFFHNAVFQDAREVHTKYSKTFTTYFFPVGDDVRQIIVEWVSLLKTELLFGNDDPLFPKTEVKRGKAGGFESVGLTNKHWANAAAIRRIFKQAFAVANLPNFNPHSFRSTLASLGETLCRTPEQFKAWSQNLGHEGVLTTLYSYGSVSDGRQSDIIRQFSEPHRHVLLNGMDISVAALARELSEVMAHRSVKIS